MTPLKSIRYATAALRDLRRHGNMAARIAKAMDDYAADPASHANNVTKLVGAQTHRMRVGAFRVLFEDDGDTLLVTKIGPRGSIYD